MADEAFHIGASPSSESYLVQDNIIKAAKDSGADAIHPGYGFLAENAEFAQRCIDENIIFIGPKPETIRLLGDKLEARKVAIASDMPLVPGCEFDNENMQDALIKADEIGYPILVKAAAGGGGKGMRVVEKPEDFEEGLKRAASEAISAFGDGRVYIGKYLLRPRHIEIQILTDQHGNGIHLNERECSIQRRHQKLIEESPSPVMTPELRKEMGDAALRICKETHYVGAGTVEFMVDEDMSYYFLEVNTRLQVEHPVTELVTGVDLVKEQIAVAEGAKLTLTQDDIGINGHSIECRICAEDPQQNFMPCTGVLKNYRLPAGPGVRVDSGVVIYSEVPIYYDPMIAKMIVWGKDRTEAIERCKRALEEYRVSGLKTTIGFCRVVMDNEKFISGDISTAFINEEYPDHNFVILSDELKEQAALAVAVDTFINERKILLSEDNNNKQSEWKNHHRKQAVKRLGGNS